jgi:hypothetical protein
VININDLAEMSKTPSDLNFVVKGEEDLKCDVQLGEGGYGRVYRVIKCQNECLH